MKTQTYANSGACRRNARATLGADTKRGVHFQMEMLEDGRWRWWRLSEDAPQANPKTENRKRETAKRRTDRKAEAVRTDGLTREAWLREGVVRLHEEVFKPHLDGASLPKHRVSCGFPAGARPSQQKGGAIGSCHDPKASADGHTEMFVSPVLADQSRVLGVLAHEMVHMYVGIEAKHGPAFKALATAIGLEGKMTATTEGPAFLDAIAPMLSDMGDYPHAKLGGDVLKPKNPVRQVPLFCDDEECGVTFRIAKKYIDAHGGDSVLQSPTSDLCCPACGGSMTIRWPKDRTK